MRTTFRIGLFLVLAGGQAMFAARADAQAPSLEGLDASSTSQSSLGNPQKTTETRHRFWDKENNWLFAGVGAARTLDYFSTLNMRRRGRQEILLTNEAVDNHAAFASIEASAVGASIGASYLFHRYGHHKLERWTSVIHFGLTAGGAVRNYCLKTAHRASP